MYTYYNITKTTDIDIVVDTRHNNIWPRLDMPQFNPIMYNPKK